MYRFGWKKSDKIHYYSELLGMKDTITEDDLEIEGLKTIKEEKIDSVDSEKEILKERLAMMEMQMRKMMEMMNGVNN